MQMQGEEDRLVVGVLAIQGAVEEHMQCIRQLGHIAKEVRMPEDLNDLDGLIMPGGESTAMAIVGEKRGLFPALKTWVQARRPVWGTCAGMILLSNYAIKQAEGGQSLVGGLDVQVCRNYFGSQVHSCEININLENTSFLGTDVSTESDKPFNAVFIRAPAILKVGPDVEVIARLQCQPHVSALSEVLSTLQLSSDSPKNSSDAFNVIVAVKQDNIFATAFHPELTNDLRWHQAFINMIKAAKANK